MRTGDAANSGRDRHLVARAHRQTLLARVLGDYFRVVRPPAVVFDTDVTEQTLRRVFPTTRSWSISPRRAIR